MKVQFNYADENEILEDTVNSFTRQTDYILVFNSTK